MTRIADPQTSGERIERIEQSIASDLGKRESYDTAITDYSRLLAHEPFNALLYRHRGHRYLSISHFEQAAADLEIATRLDPGYWKNWNYLGMIYYMLGDFQTAISYYEQAMMVTGKASVYYVAMVNWKYLCLCHLGQKDSEEAKRTLEAIKPETKEAIKNYKDLVLMNKGNISVEEIEGILTPDMNEIEYSTYGFGLAMNYYFNGDKAKARKKLQHIYNTSKSWYALGFMACKADLDRLF